MSKIRGPRAVANSAPRTHSRANRLATGVTLFGVLLTPACSAAEGEGTPNDAATPSHATVYYQPRKSDLHDPQSLRLPAGVYTMVAEPGQSNSWAIGNCRPDAAAGFLNAPGTEGVDRVAGFSLGRLGLLYLLQAASPQQRAGIDYMIVFDPANAEDFTDSCDPPDTSLRLRQWLGESATHRLVVIAGQHTAQGDHAGIRATYFSQITGTSVAEQVIVCDTGRGHEATFNEHKDLLTAPKITTPAMCPPGTKAWQPIT